MEETTIEMLTSMPSNEATDLEEIPDQTPEVTENE